MSRKNAQRKSLRKARRLPNQAANLKIFKIITKSCAIYMEALNPTRHY